MVLELNHFCPAVLQRITIPDFLDFMRTVFPYLYAIDIDNTTIVDLHVPDRAYMVMHEHVVKNRFPNLVGGFEPKVREKLATLESEAQGVVSLSKSLIYMISRKLGAAAASFKTPPLSRPLGKIITQASDYEVTTGSLFEISVRVTKESKETWHGYGDHPFFLSYHWTRNGSDFLIYKGIRTELIKPEVTHGETFEQRIRIEAPNKRGKFKLVLTLVQEGVCWFEDRGFEPALLNIGVS